MIRADARYTSAPAIKNAVVVDIRIQFEGVTAHPNSNRLCPEAGGQVQ